MERFTEQASKVIALAEREARSFNHNYIGTEHLLLGHLQESEYVLARVLPNVDLNEVRREVVRMLGGSHSEASFTVGRGRDDHGF